MKRLRPLVLPCAVALALLLSLLALALSLLCLARSQPRAQTPLAPYIALLGQMQPAGGECWSDYWTPHWELQMQFCWYQRYNLTIEGGRVTRVYGRIEGVRAGDILLWYGPPHSIGGFSTVTALRYPGMNVYVWTSAGLTPHSAVYSISLWDVEQERG